MSNYLTQFFLVSDQKLPISHAYIEFDDTI
jgi:hypothetical protein